MTLTLGTVLFFILGLIAIAAAIGMLTATNAVHAALFLVVNFFCIALFYLGLSAPFIAMVQITVYAGAIMVLFLFVIMLVNLDEAVHDRQFNRQWLLGTAAALVLLAELAYGLHRGRQGFSVAGAIPGAVQPNTQAIADALYQQYMLPFEIASIMLLVAMVGAVVMAKKRL